MNSIQNIANMYETLLWLKENFREKNEDGDYKWDVSDLNLYFPQVLYGNVVNIHLVEAEKIVPVVVKEKVPTQTEIITQELIETLPEDVVSVSVEPPVAPAPRRGGRRKQ